MRIRYLLAFLLLAVGFYCEGYNDDDDRGYSVGAVIYGNESLKTIHANGFVSLNGTQVLGGVRINGNLEAISASIGALQVNGQVRLNHCIIQGETLINGALEAENSKFHDIEIASQNITLRSCVVGSLKILKTGNLKQTQILDARGKNIIAGAVTFESGNGQILTTPETQIIGVIRGAKIYQK